MMKNDKLFAEFEDLAEKLDLKILKGKGDFMGGTCIVNNKKVIVINKQKPVEQRLKTLANCFLEFDLAFSNSNSLENFFILASINDFIFFPVDERYNWDEEISAS